MRWQLIRLGICKTVDPKDHRKKLMRKEDILKILKKGDET